MYTVHNMHNSIITKVLYISINYDSITMVMDTIQIRMSSEMVKVVDSFIKKGMYSSRSDVIRGAVRSFFWEKEVGGIPNTGIDSVKEIRKIRKILSKQPIDLKEINSL